MGTFISRFPWGRLALLISALVLYGQAAAQAATAASAWARTDQSAVRLISAAEGVGDGRTLQLGLHFRLKKNWKIYWRSPGDAGYPPRLDWSGSDNLAQARLSWPAPQRFSVLGFETLGYKNEVVLPITAQVERPGGAFSGRLSVDYLACAEICIPYQATLALDLPAGPAVPSAFGHLINRFGVQVPGDGAAHGVSITGAVASGKVLRVRVTATLPFAAPDVYVEGPEELAFGPPRVRLEDGGLGAQLEVPIFGLEDLEKGLVGSRVTLTLLDGARSAERTLVVGAAAAGAAPAGDGAAGLSLAWVLVLAVIGGLILNLMPCVLPVLSIKLLGVIGHGGGEVRTVRLSFIASAAGIIFSFLVLAGALVALKASGAAIGWGIQFQQPWFLVAMSLVIVLFACNLWGFFEFQLPQALAGLGGHGSRPHGQGGGQGGGMGGHFLTGAFATLLATPCSAPFLGTAVGFALARGPGEIFAIFAALGVGLALPYLVVAINPGLATRLPRPGSWMVTLKIILGFALAATAVWLLTVLAAQVGVASASAVGALLVGVCGVLFLYHRRPRRLGRAAAAIVAVLAVTAFAVPRGFSSPPPTLRDAALTDAAKDLWGPFDEAAIPSLVAAGKIVFVDVTADWCITCQVNKAFVLTKGDVLRRLSSDAVVTMQADWTRPDDGIARYLARFGRYGIPFDAVYGPGVPDGAPLSELLTQGMVLDALDRAAGASVSKR